MILTFTRMLREEIKEFRKLSKEATTKKEIDAAWEAYNTLPASISYLQRLREEAGLDREYFPTQGLFPTEQQIEAKFHSAHPTVIPRYWQKFPKLKDRYLDELIPDPEGSPKVFYPNAHRVLIPCGVMKGGAEVCLTGLLALLRSENFLDEDDKKTVEDHIKLGLQAGDDAFFESVGFLVLNTLCQNLDPDEQRTYTNTLMSYFRVLMDSELTRAQKFERIHVGLDEEGKLFY